MSPIVFSQMAALTEPRRTSWTGLFREAFAGAEAGMDCRLMELVVIVFSFHTLRPAARLGHEAVDTAVERSEIWLRRNHAARLEPAERRAPDGRRIRPADAVGSWPPRLWLRASCFGMSR